MLPSREDFQALAVDYNVVPVWRELVADLTTPVATFNRLVQPGEPGFLLESVEGGERWSRFSFIGRNPIATLTSQHGKIEVDGDLLVEPPLDKGMLAALEVLLDVYTSPSIDGLPPLHGGLMGYLGYDVVREVEHLPNVPHDDQDLPEASLSIIGQLAVFDHWRQRVILLDNVVIESDTHPSVIDTLYDEACARVDQMARDGAQSTPEPFLEPPLPDDPLPEVTSPTTSALYQESVRVAKEYIRAGDIFQVVISQRFDFELDADPFDLYRVLRQVNPSPYMYFHRTESVTLVGCSPEPMVQLLEGKVTSRPIAGTRPRGKTEAEDRRLAGELREHPKEVAEHIMLVDLARNDVGRVAEYGTVEMDEMLTLERYSHVMHLTSQVSGQLRDDKTPIDVLRATMPAGTLSGAPKVRAMEIIDDLEPVKRGPYGGVVGYLDFSGNIDTAIAIRTMVVRGNHASIQAGAGVVADSVPEEEDIECHNKAKALLSAVASARRMTKARAEYDA